MARSNIDRHAREALELLESDTFKTAVQWVNGRALAEAASAKTPDEAFRASMMLQAIQGLQSRLIAYVKHGESEAAKILAEQEELREQRERSTLDRDYKVMAEAARAEWNDSKSWEQ